MQVDLESKSKELKAFVSKYDTSMFLGHISSKIYYISSENPIAELKGLSSPLRQLYYVAALNVTSCPDSSTQLVSQFSPEEWEYIKQLLNEIEKGYYQLFYPKNEEEVDEVWINKRKVAMPTFLNYFNQGPLNFEEQVIERIEEYFQPFEKEIQHHFGITIGDFLDIYNFIHELGHNFLNNTIKPKNGEPTWEEFAEEMFEKGIMPPDWNNYLPDHFKNLFEFVYDKGKMFRFKKDQLIDRFGTTKAECFLNALVIDRQESNFLYYTEPNILQSNPIFRVREGEYQAIQTSQTVNAIYNKLAQFCTKNSNLNERFYATRGKKLEEKIEQIFQRFFKNKSFVHRGFYTEEGNEQDLLFLINGVALIVEAKASKRDEPRRDPDKAYPLILVNFNETIQKGYDQAYRVKEKFINREPLKVYLDQKLKKHVVDVKTKNYHSAFSIIVTLERFGQIQTDLSELLETYDDDEQPWSVCIDDLEVFLLALERQGRKLKDLIQFLKIREKIHGSLITQDELDICGGFLNGKIDRRAMNLEEVFFLKPNYADIFDKLYEEGLGFNNERQLERKKSNNFLKYGR